MNLFLVEMLRSLAISIIDGLKKLIGINTPRTTGTPDLRTGDRIDIDGSGDRYSGSFETDSISHETDGTGYDENIETDRNSLSEE